MLHIHSPKTVSQKAYREGWKRNPQKAKRRAEPEGAPPKPPPPIVSVPDMQRRDDEPKLMKRNGHHITTRNVRSNECHWLPGAPLGDSPLCGHRTVGGGPWCAYHAERCFGTRR